MTTITAPLSAAQLRERFDSASAYSIGIEEEVMLVEPSSLKLAERAKELLRRAGDDEEQLKLEMPASQVEVTSRPCETAAQAVDQIREGRRRLLELADGTLRFISAGVHPFSPGRGYLNHGPRYEKLSEEFGILAEHQLTCALQVHIAPGDGDRALSIYNSARSYLPLLAAIAANSPFYQGIDTGLASVRPKIAELLPRHTTPPVIRSWEHYSEILAWGVNSGGFPDPTKWWWDLRMHPSWGTLEFRVADSQPSTADVAAIAALTQALCMYLGALHDAGEAPQAFDDWKISENRWMACRDGVRGQMADLATGERIETRESLELLLEKVAPYARLIGAEAQLDHARQMITCNGAMQQRRAALHDGALGATRWLTEQFLA